jgi:1-acyl-sn-glycerol-3-phosphate acyltransferase
MVFLNKLWVAVVCLVSLPYVVAVLLIQSIIGIFFKKAARVMGQKTLMLLTRYFYFCWGIKVKVEGRENIPDDRRCVFMANHQSIMDILLIYAYVNVPMAMIAKKELIFVPVIGTWMMNMGCYLLDRKDPRQAMRLFEKAAKNIDEGYPALIYPEGTRSKGPKNTEFIRGSMRVALMSNAPVVPITLNGSWKIIHGKKGRLLPAKIKIVIGKPIDTAAYGKGRQQELAAAVQQAVEHGFTKENEADRTAVPFEAKWR